MMIRSNPCVLVVGLLLACLVCFPAGAEQDLNSVLAPDGVVFSLVRIAPEDGTSSLHLEVSRPDGSVDYTAVPGTQGSELEDSEALLFDPVDEIVYVLWESSHEHFSPYSRLLLSRYSADSQSHGEWSDPLQLSLTSFVEKSSFRLALTRDRFIASGESGELHSQRRTVLHLAWIEDNGSRMDSIAYSPIILVDGRMERASAPIRLEELALGAAKVTGSGAGLQNTVLSIHEGTDSKSVVMVAGIRGTDRLFSVEMRALPAETSRLADDLRDLVATATPGSDLEKEALALIDRAASYLSGPFVDLAKKQVAETLAVGRGDAATLANAIRLEILDLGERLEEGGVQKVTGGARHHWINVGVRSPQAPTGGGAPSRETRSHQVAVRTVQDTDIPSLLGADPDVRPVFLNSRDGRGFAVYTVQGDGLKYQESRENGGWGEVGQLAIDGDVELNDAVRLLQDRLNNR